jgi:Zn-dependent peptidase ImmA (M78 family)
MERIQSINPQRIEWCCADYGVTPIELSDRLGISAASMTDMMAGDDSLTFNQLRKIADFFGRGVLFFLEPDAVDQTKVHTPQFRTLAQQKPELSPNLKALIERAERQRDVYLGLREDLEDAQIAPFEPPQLLADNLSGAASVVRRWLGLGEQNTFDTYRAAVEAKGMLVFRSNGYNGAWQIAKTSPILGFALYDSVCPVIVVKKQDAEAQQVFTLFHELAHVLLHKTSSIDDDGDFQSAQGMERDANSLAGLLLVPDSFLQRINDSTRPQDVSLLDEWLAPQRRAWGVSGEVVLRRLLDTGRLTPTIYAHYRKWRGEKVYLQDAGGNRGWRHREPKHIFGDRYVRTVLDALSAKHITLAKASSYLDSIKIADLHQLEKHYAGA